ncbi:MAG: hypothetical protein U0167_05810 [bacterium]
MESRSSWPAAAAAAAFLVCLPAKTSAERPPVRPQDPPDISSVVFDDTDPWRPDGGGTTSTVQGSAQGVGPQATAHVQPAARHASWIEWLLRALRSLFWGGESR